MRARTQLAMAATYCTGVGMEFQERNSDFQVPDEPTGEIIILPLISYVVAMTVRKTQVQNMTFTNIKTKKPCF